MSRNGLHESVGALSVRLIDHENVRDLHDAGLERLYLVAAARREHDDADIGGADDIDLTLTDADSFDENHIRARGVQDLGHVARGTCQAAELPARRHAADEDSAVGEVAPHSNAVAQDSAAAEGTGRIDGNHPDTLALL